MCIYPEDKMMNHEKKGERRYAKQFPTCSTSKVSSSDESSIVVVGDGGSESLDSIIVEAGESASCSSGRSTRF